MLRQLFMMLEDAAGNAFAFTKVVIGDAISAAVQGALVFVFQDKDGNAVVPRLNAEGAIVVTTDAGAPKGAVITHLEGDQTKDTEDLAGEVTLEVSKTYGKIDCQLIGTRDSLWRLELVTDEGGGGEVTTDLGHGFTGSGKGESKLCTAIKEFTTTATGVQKLRLYMTPLDKESDAYANLSTFKFD